MGKIHLNKESTRLYPGPVEGSPRAILGLLWMLTQVPIFKNNHSIGKRRPAHHDGGLCIHPDFRFSSLSCSWDSFIAVTP